jgi:lysophospholipase L1-like esterase
MFKRQIDMRSEPVKRIVALGESTTWGYCASSKEKCWASQTTQMLEEFQGSPIELINQGIGSNILTRGCPAYIWSSGATALERVNGDVIELKPDLVFLSYGLNDSRGGVAPEVFRLAYQQLIDRIRDAIDPVIVLVNLYYMREMLYEDENCPHWGESNYEITDVFNLVIQQLAEKNGLIHADIYSAEVGVDWIIDEDHGHANDLGHRIIANRVFEAIVRNCSFVARQMPDETLINWFADTYGNGPDQPSMPEEGRDALLGPE